MLDSEANRMIAAVTADVSFCYDDARNRGVAKPRRCHHSAQSADVDIADIRAAAILNP